MTTTTEAKTIYKYHFRNEANRVVHRNITRDLERREKEHQVRWPGGHIVQVGRRTTVRQGNKWLKAGGRAGKPRSHKTDKQATRAELRVEVERLTKINSETALTIDKDLVNELKKVTSELDAERRADVSAGIELVGQSGSPYWLYLWHRVVAKFQNYHPEACSIDRFVDPSGRYFNHWNCKRGG